MNQLKFIICSLVYAFKKCVRCGRVCLFLRFEGAGEGSINIAPYTCEIFFGEANKERPHYPLMPFYSCFYSMITKHAITMPGFIYYGSCMLFQ